MRPSLALPIATLALAACNMSADAREGEGERRTGQRSFDVGQFETVSLGGSYDVVVTVGPAPSVRAEGDAEEIERMEVRVEEGDLHIGRKKDKRGFSLGFRSHGPVTVHVTTPMLSAAAVGGSGDMRIDRVEGRRFAASVGGSGDIRIAALKVEEARFSVAGSGGITAAGSAARSDISVAGSGDINVGGVESRTATISIVGSGDVRAKAMDTADVSIAGSGDAILDGTARCSVSKTGSGDVRCRG